MKKFLPKSPRLIPVSIVLVFTLLNIQVRAAVFYWDPEGTYTGIPATYIGQASTQTPPVPGTLQGTWETASWSSASGGTATPIVYTEDSAPCFAVGAEATITGVASS